ncbi:MAG: polysaccharide biosynthesis tyrosine autokinase [Pyrinomonadaceae bacterium]
MSLAAPSSPFFDQAQLRHYLRIVLKRKWLILGLAVIITSLVTIQMYRLPDVYEAETMIQIEPKRSVLQTQQLMINSANYDPNYWSTQLALLTNPQLARQVVLALDLQNNPAFLSGQATPSVLSSIKKIFSGSKPKSMAQSNLPVVTDSDVDADNLTPEQLDALEPYEGVISANLIVNPLKDTNLVTLYFRHNDPVIASKVANTLAEAFIANDVRRETKGSDRASDILARNIIELQMKIKQGEEARINYLKNHNLPLGSGAGQNLTVERLGMVSNQLLTAENERKNAQAVYEGAIKEDDVWSIPEVQADARIAALRGKIAELEEKRVAMLVTYTQEWPEVKKLDEQIKRIKQDLDRAPQEILRSLKTRYEVAVVKEGRLKQGYGVEKGEANEQNIAAIDLSKITTELETNKQYYNTLFQRQKELMITSLDRANNVTVATPARTPRAPVGPQRLRNIIVSLLLSIGIGVGLAFLLDFLDDSLKSTEDVENHVHLPTLALIPAPRVERGLLKGSKAIEPAGPNSCAGIDQRCTLISIRSLQAFTHVAAAFLRGTAAEEHPFTSSQPSEGKTTTAVNTAVMLAQTGASVLLVDCDLRRPRLHFHFNLLNKRGVSNFLSGDADIDSMFQPYEALPNLKVLVSGPVPPNPAELLGSDEMRRLMLQLNERFTHVVIDSPPAISFTDASILSTMVDGVVLVVHGGRSSRAVVRRAKQRLLDVGANIYGVVLNNVKADASEYYYGGYYADYYSEEEQQSEKPPAAGAIGTGAS